MMMQNTEIMGKAMLEGETMMMEDATIMGEAMLEGDTMMMEDAMVMGDAEFEAITQIDGSLIVPTQTATIDQTTSSLELAGAVSSSISILNGGVLRNIPPAPVDGVCSN